MSYQADTVDVIVVGGGHAGIEAALAAARLGLSTILFSMSLDFIANLPCNPSIGGTAKGHLVREIDALGGEMGRAADAAMLQSRMLNRGKGPAVHSLRAQVDRSGYHTYMKQVLEDQPNLLVRQAEITEILVDQQNHVTGVLTKLGAEYSTKAVVLATGTFLQAKIHVGDVSYSSGPDGLQAAQALSESLEHIGIPLRRFKTGTPARVHKDSIDFSVLEEQPGEEPVIPFSFGNKRELKNLLSCYIAYTNPTTHQIIKENLDRSPLYGGRVEWVGARYCPSIEDKVVRFEGKDRHQIFIEPVGLHTKELYLQGLSTSLPEDLQIRIYRSLKGFENLKIMRNAYAIEYDCIDPLNLTPTLESKAVSGLYFAGQINGTSGYEEAASQGLVAGINAAALVLDREPLVLPRSSSYIGTLVDDLVTKGTNEPYRMMTSRSEYRLLLRQDNADVRLTPIGREIGLIDDERWKLFHAKQLAVAKETKRLEQTGIAPSQALNNLLESLSTAPLQSGLKLATLLRRPQVTYEMLAEFDSTRPALPHDVCEQVEIAIKYSGYIDKQIQQVEQAKKLEDTPLSPDLEYAMIQGLRIEARQKLDRVKPLSVGQASRISGVSPADISVLMIYLEQQKRKGKEA